MTNPDVSGELVLLDLRFVRCDYRTDRDVVALSSERYWRFVRWSFDENSRFQPDSNPQVLQSLAGDMPSIPLQSPLDRQRSFRSMSRHRRGYPLHWPAQWPSRLCDSTCSIWKERKRPVTQLKQRLIVEYRERQRQRRTRRKKPKQSYTNERSRSEGAIQRKGDLLSRFILAQNEILLFGMLLAQLSFEPFAIFHQTQLFRTQFLFLIRLESAEVRLRGPTILHLPIVFRLRSTCVHYRRELSPDFPVFFSLLPRKRDRTMIINRRKFVIYLLGDEFPHFITISFLQFD